MKIDGKTYILVDAPLEGEICSLCAFGESLRKCSLGLDECTDEDNENKHYKLKEEEK